MLTRLLSMLARPVRRAAKKAEVRAARGLLLAARSISRRGGIGQPEGDRVWRTSTDGSLRLTELAQPLDAPADVLPSELIIAAGVYTVSGRAYDFTACGLYRGSGTDGSGAWQRVVIGGEVSALAVAMVVAGLGYHGWLDNFRAFDKAARIATRRPLLQTCGHLSEFCVQLLTGQGFLARRVEWFRAGRFNGSDDGHTMIEVFDEPLGKWVCVDVDQNRVFLDADSTRLSAFEIWKAGFSAVSSLEFAGRALADVVGIGRGVSAPLAAAYVADLTHDWYAEVCHHLGLHDAGGIVCVGESDYGTAAARYSFIAEDHWLERHYF